MIRTDTKILYMAKMEPGASCAPISSAQKIGYKILASLFVEKLLIYHWWGVKDTSGDSNRWSSRVFCSGIILKSEDG
jgi:hypothetical protein